MVRVVRQPNSYSTEQLLPAKFDEWNSNIGKYEPDEHDTKPIVEDENVRIEKRQGSHLDRSF